MRVTSALAGSAAGPVLDHAVDRTSAPAVLSPFSGLECVAVLAHNVAVEFRTFAESSIETPPTGVGGEVSLRREGCGDAEGAVFRGNNLPMPAGNLGVESRCHSHLPRPE